MDSISDNAGQGNQELSVARNASPHAGPRSRLNHRVGHYATIAGILALFSLLVSGAIRTSLTADESTYIALGHGRLWAAAADLMIATAISARWPHKRIALGLQGGAAAGLSLVALWAGYGFERGRVHGFPLPVPAPTHWENVL